MEIERATMELPDTKTLRLKWPEDYAMDFLTGQFITVYWPHKQKYKRAYSLSSSALDRGHFEITIMIALSWTLVSVFYWFQSSSKIVSRHSKSLFFAPAAQFLSKVRLKPSV